MDVTLQIAYKDVHIHAQTTIATYMYLFLATNQITQTHFPAAVVINQFDSHKRPVWRKVLPVLYTDSFPNS